MSQGMAGADLLSALGTVLPMVQVRQHHDCAWAAGAAGGVHGAAGAQAVAHHGRLRRAEGRPDRRPGAPPILFMASDALPCMCEV